MRKSCLAAALAVAWAAPLPAQQQPTFRSTQTLVPMFVTVADAKQRLVTDLTQDDFSIFDNDKPQTIAVFDNQIQPISVVVMLDTSGSMTLNLSRVRSAAEQFIMRLLPEDKGRVGAFNDKIQMSREFTNNRDRLISEIGALDFGNGTLLWDAMIMSADVLKEIDGRKVILTLTDGADFGSKSGLGDVLDRMRDQEIMVYAIGLAGSEPGPNGRAVRTKPEGGLKKLAEETGGGYFELEDTAELGATFSRVAQELHSQYTLGFVPTTLDNKVHKLAVKLKQPGLTARARKTYVAKPQTTEGSK
ncbi:MAG TPA: VWA domain-containing protein [Vicinamibacterales bacterium]|jgi:Ca-activated chloride channel family protein|nr:VWA domain-containing protein [Vicinamibacterales bacterium]